jgi:hypothetical protein
LKIPPANWNQQPKKETFDQFQADNVIKQKGFTLTARYKKYIFFKAEASSNLETLI